MEAGSASPPGSEFSGSLDLEVHHPIPASAADVSVLVGEPHSPMVRSFLQAGVFVLVFGSNESAC